MNSSFLSRAAAAATSVAVAAAFALPVQAAAITTITVNGGTTLAASAQVTTIAFDPVTALTDGSTFIVTYPSSFTETSFDPADVAVADTDAGSYTVSGVDTTANTISVTVTDDGTAGTDIVTLTISNNALQAPASGIGSFGVSTSVGDTGAVLIYVANANQVAVTATVLPTLTLAINNGPIAFGTLATGAFTTDSVTVDYATNAATGMTVSMAATGLKTATSEIGVQNLDSTASNESGFYKVSTNASPVFTSTDSAVSAAAGADVRATQTLFTASAPATVTAAPVTLGAEITAATPAGSYADVLTFTATASF